METPNEQTDFERIIDDLSRAWVDAARALVELQREAIREGLQWLADALNELNGRSEV